MMHVRALPVGRQLEVLGQPLVEPERHVLEHAVQHGVREFVAQVFLDTVSPEGVDEQVLRPADAVRLGDEKGAAFRQVGILQVHEALVLVAVLEEVHLHEGFGAGQLQFLVNQVAQFGQLLKDGLVPFQVEIVKEDEL